MGSQKTKEQIEPGPLCLSNPKLEAQRLTHLRKGKSMLKSLSSKPWVLICGQEI